MSFQNSVGPDGYDHPFIQIHQHQCYSFLRKNRSSSRKPKARNCTSIFKHRSMKSNNGGEEKEPSIKNLSILTLPDMFLSAPKKSLKSQLINNTSMNMLKGLDLVVDLASENDPIPLLLLRILFSRCTSSKTTIFPVIFKAGK